MLAGTSDCATDSERIDRIRLLDELKSAAAAAQARETAAFAASQRQEQLDVGVPAERASRGIAAQVALARRISPHSAQRYVGWSTILTTELSATFAALVCGATTEWRAMLVARETAWLSREHRALVDREFAGRLESLGDKRVEHETKKAAYRPALYREADTLIGVGDRRGRGQIMADTLVARLTGQATASDVPLEVNLVMTSSSLLDPRSSNAADDGGISGAADSEGAARLDGYGTVPAAWARELVLGAA